MDKLRVFVAVDLPAALQGKFAYVAERLRHLPGEVRWVSGPHLHLTLRFLGELEPSQVEAVKAAAVQAASRHRPFELTLSGLGLFPERGEPKVLWVGVRDGRSELAALQADVESELETRGFAPEGRPFTPHLTLARLRGASPAWRTAVAAFGAEPRLSFTVEEVRVMRSELTRRGPIYSSLAAVPLRQ